VATVLTSITMAKLLAAFKTKQALTSMDLVVVEQTTIRL